MRLLADENIDHRVIHRLEHYGHDVEHVSTTPALGKGASDGSVAAHSLETERLILTSDDDFLTEFEADEYSGLLLVEDESLQPATVADTVHEIAAALDGAPDGIIYVSRNWL